MPWIMKATFHKLRMVPKAVFNIVEPKSGPSPQPVPSVGEVVSPLLSLMLDFMIWRRSTHSQNLCQPRQMLVNTVWTLLGVFHITNHIATIKHGGVKGNVTAFQVLAMVFQTGLHMVCMSSSPLTLDTLTSKRCLLYIITDSCYVV
jgi:hypothetical protein